MKTLFLVVCCLVSALAAKDTIGRIVDPITSLAKVKDASYECSRSCLVAAVKQVLRPSSDLKKLQNQKGGALLILKSLCDVYANGKECLNSCPNGELKEILEGLSSPLNYACDNFDRIKHSLNAIPETMNFNFSTCEKCGDKDPLNIALFSPQYVKDAKKKCENKKCYVECVNQLLSEGGFEEAAKMNSELTKRVMTVIVGTNVILNDLVTIPEACQWFFE